MKVKSHDGTEIAFERRGSGRPTILVDGALCRRGIGPNTSLAATLAEHCEVITYDRRGRGESGDASSYSVGREVEDLVAVIDEVGGRADVYGISSGGMLALELAKLNPERTRRVAVYEVPMVIDDSRAPVRSDLPADVEDLLAKDRNGAAVKLFMREVVGLPGFLVASMPLFPGWSKNKEMAVTLPYDLAVMGDTQRGEPLAAGRWSSLRAPVLVADGSKSPAWVRNGAAALAAAIPSAADKTLEGQTHRVKGSTLGPVLAEFFGAAVATEGDERVREGHSGR